MNSNYQTANKSAARRPGGLHVQVREPAVLDTGHVPAPAGGRGAIITIIITIIIIIIMSFLFYNYYDY